MPAPAISRQLLDDLNYLNTAEIKSFCKRYSIPFTIAIETEDGRRRKTQDDDRKAVILGRIRHFLQTGEVLPQTVLPAAIVCFDPLPKKLTADHRLFYGQYDKTSPAMISLLKSLTGGEFKSGAIARILARKFWSAGIAPTFREYGAAWLHDKRSHTKPSPEAAYLSDRANKTAPPDWKKLRVAKASKVIKVLNGITAP
jgi:hypothetical protein